MASAPADLVVPSSPADTPSSVHFAPRSAGSDSDYLCATAWDGSVSVWEVSGGGSSIIPRAKSSHAAPALCSTWSADGTAVISGGCDHQVRLWSVASNQTMIIGSHAEPVRSVFDLSSAESHVPSIVSASWDRTIKYWDTRSASSGVEGVAPAAAAISVNVSERVYAMDVKGVVMAVACAERNIHIFDLRKPNEILKTIPSPLKFQSRSLSIFPDQQGFALGSVEGRVAISYISDPPGGSDPTVADPRNFAFKCHRSGNDVFAVNDIVFHPIFGTFVTLGGDGTYVCWDKDVKQRLKVFPSQGNSIMCASFNPSGTLLAYGVGYDWSKGLEGAEAKSKINHIALHRCSEDMKRKEPAAGAQ